MSHMCPSLLGPTMAFVCVSGYDATSPSCHGQSECCVGCGSWNWEPFFTCHYCVMAPRTSNGNSWVQVAKCGKTSEKSERKVAHVKQLYTSAQARCSPLACANGEKFRVCETVACVIARRADWQWEAFRGASRALLLRCLSDGIIMVSGYVSWAYSHRPPASQSCHCVVTSVYLGFCWWNATESIQLRPCPKIANSKHDHDVV